MDIRLQPKAIPEALKQARHLAKTACSTAAFTVFLSFAVPAQADEPGRGRTAEFEREYLMMIINHHYSALRMTELAAGTDPERDAALNNNQEGTAATPDTSATPAKASSNEIKSMARQANRMQREEIKTAQHFLQEWYGQQHSPQLTQEGYQQIQRLEQTAAGNQFDRAFLEVFSNHHYGALQPSLDCEVKVDIRHDALKRYCHGIVEHQKIEINNMREQLCTRFNVCDFQPSSANRQ